MLFRFTLIIVPIGLITIGVGLYDYSRQVLLFPSVVVAFGCVAAVAAAAREWHPDGGNLDPSGIDTLRQDIRHLFAAVLAIPAGLIFGLVLGAALYLTVVLRARGENWRLSIITGAGVSLAIHTLFATFLAVPLPSGILGDMLPW